MLDFGAVVEYTQAPGNEVLLHVSELAWERTENVSDVVNMGDVLDVKYFGIDSRTKKEKVSRKALLPRPEKKNNILNTFCNILSFCSYYIYYLNLN